MKEYHVWTMQRLFMTCIVLFTTVMAFAADGIHTERIHFKKGASSTNIVASIKGYETVDYVVGARAGQHMTISLATKHGATYFNVLAPGEDEVAMFNASLSSNKYEGVLTTDGDYKIRVYMMRSAARRNEISRYTLTVGITGSAKPHDFGSPDLGRAPGSDAKVEGTPYHATGPIPCSLGSGQPVQCEFGVIRSKAGNAEVHITPPGGLKRVLLFMGDKVTTNPGEKITVVKNGTDWHIEINDYEHYTIPEAVVLGG